MSDTTEKVIDTAADVAGEMAQQAGEVEQAIRSLNRAKVQFYLLGMAVGGLTGAVIAFKVAYWKAETKYSKISDEEIEEMRKHYREKTRAAEASAAKRPLEEIVEEQGYSSSDARSEAPPMAVPPPVAVVLENQDEEEEEEEVTVEPEVRNIFEDAKVTHEWNYHEELRKRSPNIPYVIHYDERHEIEYQEVTLNYYELDDVLCNERDEVVDPDERDAMIGADTLERFGHGSNDAVIVFVRNDKLEIVFEIVKTPNSFAEEVHGFAHDDLYHGNLERMRARERDEQED